LERNSPNIFHNEGRRLIELLENETVRCFVRFREMLYQYNKLKWWGK
jgi:hypothetical protein